MRQQMRNPIIWNCAKWRWRDRKVPLKMSHFEFTHGSVALRRALPPGVIAMRQILNRLRWLGA